MIVRVTAKLAALLGVKPDAGPEPGGDDWYANLLWITGRKNLLVTHAATLFSVVIVDVKAAQLRPSGPLLVAEIENRLRQEQLPPDGLGCLDPDHITVAKTADRRVLGAMNDLAYLCQITAERDGLAELATDRFHHHLHRHLISTTGHAHPIDLATDRSRTRTGPQKQPGG